MPKHQSKKIKYSSEDKITFGVQTCTLKPGFCLVANFEWKQPQNNYDTSTLEIDCSTSLGLFLNLAITV